MRLKLLPSFFKLYFLLNAYGILVHLFRIPLNEEFFHQFIIHHSSLKKGGVILDYMKIALDEARKALNKGEVPVGAVIVKEGKIIAAAHNLKETNKNAMAHAEMIAIDMASKVIGDWRLNGCEMYVTLEPCAMCTSAIAHARISKLYIGSFNRDMGACGSILNLLDYKMFNTEVQVNWNYDEECSKILAEFFNSKRKIK